MSIVSSKALELPTAMPPPFQNTYFEDDVWTVDVPSKGRSASLTWNGITLADGSYLTAPKNRALLNCAKVYFWHASQGTSEEKPLKGSSLTAHFIYMRSLLIWMSGRNLTNFEGFTLAHAIGYRNYLQHRRVKAPKSRRVADTEKLKLSSGSVRHYLGLVLRLVRMQNSMRRYGTAFSTADLHDLFDYLCVEVTTEKSTLVIPNETFKTFLNTAIYWVENEAPKVIALYEVFAEYKAQRKGKLNTRAAFERFAATKLPLGVTVEFLGRSENLLSISYPDLMSLMTLTRGACYVVIASLVGMRESEMLSLQRGCLLPQELQAGLRIYQISGTLFKTARPNEGVAAQWVAGYEEPENPIPSAVAILERMPNSDRGLFAGFHAWKRKAKKRVTSTILKRALDLFSKHCGITDWDLASHQFRKKFAQCVAASGSASILVLMRHFKHQSVLMTERYLPCDPELLNDIFEASQELIADRLDSVFAADRLGGIGGNRILLNNAAFRGDANAARRKELVDITMRDPSIHFRLSPYGICIYEEDLARCRGRIERVGLDTCVNCSNFIVDRVNEPFWNEHAAVLTNAISERAELGLDVSELERRLQDASRVQESFRTR